jgi:glycosyltransferase involved in cell wall biosynthesis
MVGTLEPRKGHQQMLGIFEQLWNQDEDIQLVIVGRHGWLMEEFLEKLKNHGELSKRLYWLPGASDEFLAKIYDACTCLLAGSIDEGYGLPLVEAIQRDKSVLARDIEVFREIGGLNVSYFKDNKNEFVGYINEIRQRDCLKNKTLSKFTNWKTHVQQLKNKIYNKRKTKKCFDLVQVEKETTRVINMQIKFQSKPNQATGANQKMSEIRKAVNLILLKS